MAQLLPVPREIRRALKLPKDAKIEVDGKDHIHETWIITKADGTQIGEAYKKDEKWHWSR